MLPDVEADEAKLPWYWSLPKNCLPVIGLDEEIAASSILSRGGVPWQRLGLSHTVAYASAIWFYSTKLLDSRALLFNAQELDQRSQVSQFGCFDWMTAVVSCTWRLPPSQCQLSLRSIMNAHLLDSEGEAFCA